jgi:hypothetical protein
MILWTSVRRERFIMTVVTEFLHDHDFVKEEEKSDICSLLLWYSEGTTDPVDKKFVALLKHCNNYHDGLSKLVLNFVLST